MYGWADFSVTMGLLQNYSYFQRFYCSKTDHCFYILHYNIVQTIVFTHLGGVAINYMGITVILQPAHCDIKFGPAICK